MNLSVQAIGFLFPVNQAVEVVILLSCNFSSEKLDFPSLNELLKFYFTLFDGAAFSQKLQ